MLNLKVNVYSPVETQVIIDDMQYEINPYMGNDKIQADTEYPFSVEVRTKGFSKVINITNENVADYLVPFPERERPEISIFIEKEVSAQKIKACYDREKALSFLENLQEDMTGAAYACLQLAETGEPEDIKIIEKCLDCENICIRTRAALAVTKISKKYDIDISQLLNKILDDYKKISHIRLYGSLIENAAIEIGADNIILTVFSPVEMDVYADKNFIFRVDPYTGFDYKTKSVHYPVKIKVVAKNFVKVFEINESNINDLAEPNLDKNSNTKTINIFMKNYLSRNEIKACYDRSKAIKFLQGLLENPEKMGGGYACEQLEELGKPEDLPLLYDCIKVGSSFVKAKATIAADKICKRNDITAAEYAKNIKKSYSGTNNKEAICDYVLKSTVSGLVKNVALLTIFSPVDAVVYSGRTNEKLFEINLYSGLDYAFCYIDYPDDIIVVAKGFEKVFSINDETLELYKDQITDESECARVSIFLKNFVDESEINSCFERERALDFLNSIKDSPKSLGASYACRQLEVVGKPEDIELLKIFEENSTPYIKLRARNTIMKIKQKYEQ